MFRVEFSQLGSEVNYHLYLGFKAQCSIFRSSLTARSQFCVFSFPYKVVNTLILKIGYLFGEHVCTKTLFHGLTTLWFDENYTIHLKHLRSLLKRKANPWFPTQTGQLGPWWTGRCLISSGMCGPHPFLPGASTTHLPWRPLLICLFLLEGYFLWSLSWSARQDFFFLTLFPKHLRIHDSHVALNTVAVNMAHLISLIRL